MHSKEVTKALREIFSIRGKRGKQKYGNRKTLIIHKIDQNINKFHGSQFNEFVQRLFSHPLFKGIYKDTYSEPHELFSNANFRIKKIENEFLWFENVFIHNADKINTYLSSQNIIDIAILNNNGGKALQTIDFLDNELGYSLWSIEYKTHIKKELMGENSTAYLSSIKDKGNKQLEFYIQQLIYKSESKNIYSFIDNLLAHLNLIRLDNSKDQAIHYADMFAAYFIPLEFDIDRNVETRKLFCMMNLSIIDQYNMLKKYLLNKKSKNLILEEFEKNMLNNILNYIEDVELKNLLNTELMMSDIDGRILEIIKEYTLSNYAITKKKINLLLQETPSATSLIEVYARNTLYLEDEVNNNLFDKISNKFKQILLAEESHDAINYIEKITIKFNLSSWVNPILFQLYNLIYTTEHKKDFSKRQMLILGTKVTPLSVKDFSYTKLFELLEIEQGKLSPYRFVKTFDTSIFKDEKDIEIFYLKYKKNTIILTDYLKNWANYLINQNKLLECASFLVDNYLDNNQYHYILPFEKLINAIEENNLSTMIIDIPIMYDIYHKKVDNSKIDERSEAYEDFIDTFDTHKPSNIFRENSVVNNKELYFLKYLAIPSIMDISSEFTSSIELKKERLEILNILDGFTKDKDEILTERNNLFDELVFEQLKASFNSSKIYVDVESLKIDKEYEYKRLYDIFLASKIIYNENDKNDENEFITIADSEEGTVLMPSSDLADIVVQIYKRLVEDFLKNEDYGLDKYLSTEIRHDVFFTQLRSSIEKYHLLTEIGENDEYEENSIWREEYQLISNNVTNAIDDRLKTFSRNIDLLLKQTNTWFNVIDSSSASLTGGMFDFLPTYERLKDLKFRLLEVENFNSFFNEILAFMWEVTYESTEHIKKKLEEEFKVTLLSIVDTLNDDIVEVTGSINTRKLLDAISLAKGNIIEDIDRVSSWLNRIEDDSKFYSMDSILRECTNMFKTTFINKEMKFVYTFIELNVELSYLEARAMMNSIFIALDNIIKYGEKEKSVYEIYIVIENKGNNEFVISIKNKFKLIGDLGVFTNELKKRLSPKYKQLSRQEGGTGLHKIYNLLTNVSDKFKIDIDVSNTEFKVLIGIKNENYND